MKTIAITATIEMRGDSAEDIEVILTVDTSRVINTGNCGAILRALYPNHAITGIKYQVLPN
jgi:hypothetical protein